MDIRQVDCKMCGESKTENAEKALKYVAPRDVCTSCWTGRNEAEGTK